MPTRAPATSASGSSRTTSACDSAGGTGPFTGDHTDGDLLVVSEFSNGGVVSTIQVYRWDGGANGTLNPNSVAGGANLDCDIVTGGDSVCANVNTATITASRG